MIEFFFVFLEAELSSLIFLLYFNRELSKLKKKKPCTPTPPPPKKILIFWEMELSCSNINKFLIFQENGNPKKNSLYFREMELFSSNIRKFLKVLSEESFSYISGNGTFLYFRKWKPRKKSFIFYQKKAFLIFQEMETPQKFFILQEIELSYI